MTKQDVAVALGQPGEWVPMGKKRELIQRGGRNFTMRGWTQDVLLHSGNRDGRGGPSILVFPLCQFV